MGQLDLQPGESWCLQCEGTGHGPCANCGDLSVTECACENPEETECDVCEGTGKVQEEEDDRVLTRHGMKGVKGQ